MPNQFTTRRVEIYLHFEVGGKVHFRPNGEREWRKAEVLPRSHQVEDEHGLAYWRNRRHIITAPNDLFMIPRPSGPPTGSQPWDPPPASSLTLTPEGQVPSPLKLTDTNRNRFKHTHFNQIWATKSTGNSDSVNPARGKYCNFERVGTLRHRGPWLFYLCAPKTNASCVETFGMFFQCQVFLGFGLCFD